MLGCIQKGSLWVYCKAKRLSPPIEEKPSTPKVRFGRNVQSYLDEESEEEGEEDQDLQEDVPMEESWCKRTPLVTPAYDLGIQANSWGLPQTPRWLFTPVKPDAQPS